MNSVDNNIIYSLQLFRYAIENDDRLVISVLKNDVDIFIGAFYKIKDKFILRLNISKTIQYNFSEVVNFLIESRYCTAIKNKHYIDLILTNKALLILL